MATKLIIPKKIHNKYTYLLNRFKDLEWSGPAWYKVKTDEDGVVVIKVVSLNAFVESNLPVPVVPIAE